MYPKFFITVYTKKIKLKLVSSEYIFSQQTFVCSRSTIETLEKGVKYVQS